jgi:hypothetical protein
MHFKGVGFGGGTEGFEVTLHYGALQKLKINFGAGGPSGIARGCFKGALHPGTGTDGFFGLGEREDADS